MSYAGMTLQQMADMVRKEVSHVPRLRQASRMWQEARDELALSGESLRREIEALAPQWTDQAGDLFAARATKAERGMAEWVARIDAAQPWKALDDLAKDIPEAKEYIELCLATQKQLMAAANASGAGSAEGQYAELQRQAAARMQVLAGYFTAATSAVEAAGQGAGVTSAGGGGGSEAAGGGPGGGPAGGPASGPAGGPAGAAAGGPAGGAAGGPAGGAAGGPAGGPALAGGAAAPPKLPSLPPPVDLPPARPAPALPQLPMAPPVGTPGVLSARGVAGRGIGGAGLTGQSGVPMIPRAAKPGTFSAAALTPPPPPVLPTAGPASTSSAATRGGGVPPMVPPTSGAAPSGSGKPKPGQAQRPPAGKGRQRVGTPGVPDTLRGRANAGGVLPTRTDRRRTAEAEALDEELWQTEEPRSPLTGR